MKFDTPQFDFSVPERFTAREVLIYNKELEAIKTRRYVKEMEAIRENGGFIYGIDYCQNGYENG